MKSHGTLLGQCSDVRCRLKRVDRSTFERTVKIHLLLFDHVRIPATQLLSSRFLYEIFQRHEDASSCLIPAGKEPSLIQPVSFGYGNFREIAETMISGGTIHSLPSDDMLVSHAQYLDSFKPRFEFCDQPSFRRRYWALFNHGLASLIGHSSTREDFRSSLSRFQTWLQRDADRDNLQQSAAVRFINAAIQKSHRKELAVLVDTAYQFAFSTFQDGHFSSAYDVLPMTQALSQSQSHASAPCDVETTTCVEDLVSTFPMDIVGPLTLEQIAILRQEEAFTQLRRGIQRFSEGLEGSTSCLERIHQNLNACTEPLKEVLSRTGLRRKSYVKLLEEEHRTTRLRLRYHKILRPILSFFTDNGLFEAALLGLENTETMLGDTKTNNLNIAHLASSYSDMLSQGSTMEGGRTEITPCFKSKKMKNLVDFGP